MDELDESNNGKIMVSEEDDSDSSNSSSNSSSEPESDCEDRNHVQAQSQPTVSFVVKSPSNSSGTGAATSSSTGAATSSAATSSGTGGTGAATSSERPRKRIKTDKNTVTQTNTVTHQQFSQHMRQLEQTLFPNQAKDANTFKVGDRVELTSRGFSNGQGYVVQQGNKNLKILWTGYIKFCNEHIKNNVKKVQSDSSDAEADTSAESASSADKQLPGRFKNNINRRKKCLGAKKNLNYIGFLSGDIIEYEGERWRLGRCGQATATCHDSSDTKKSIPWEKITIDMLREETPENNAN